MTRHIFTRLFWRDAAERAGKTAAQAALLALGADKVLDVMAADWSAVGSFALGGAALSLLTSIVSAPASGTISPASILSE